MKLEEYVQTAIQELKKFQKKWEQEHEKNPEYYPMELEEGEWGQQELSERFGQ